MGAILDQVGGMAITQAEHGNVSKGSRLCEYAFWLISLAVLWVHPIWRGEFVGFSRFSRLHGLDQWPDPHDVDAPIEIIGEHVQAHLGADPAGQRYSPVSVK